jgi:hypothetical protein
MIDAVPRDESTTSFGDVRFAEVGYPFAAPQAPFYLGDFAQIIKKIATKTTTTHSAGVIQGYFSG